MQKPHVVVLVFFVGMFWFGSGVAGDDTHSREIELGETLFLETSLSSPPGMGCIDCHDPDAAFADADRELPVSRGIIHGRFGNRNDMPLTYTSFIPPLHYDKEEEVWVGGLFWDGRANTLEIQAQGPPLNPVEMAAPDVAYIAKKLRSLPYADEFEAVYGKDALKDDQQAFNNFSQAVAAFERTDEFNRFDSKYDYYLRGEAELTEQEQRGLVLFVAPEKGNCAACHPHLAGDDGTPPLFTDFTYDNLGVPRNAELPHYTQEKSINPAGYSWIDQGLGATVKDPAFDGNFRVPTLRNIQLTSPYMHNGYFKTLFQVVAFYNSRDVAPWAEPEIGHNMNREELGNLGLSTNEMEDIVAFMNTLTDGYRPTE